MADSTKTKENKENNNESNNSSSTSTSNSNSNGQNSSQPRSRQPIKTETKIYMALHCAVVAFTILQTFFSVYSIYQTHLANKKFTNMSEFQKKKTKPITMDYRYTTSAYKNCLNFYRLALLASFSSFLWKTISFCGNNGVLNFFRKFMDCVDGQYLFLCILYAMNPSSFGGTIFLMNLNIFSLYHVFFHLPRFSPKVFKILYPFIKIYQGLSLLNIVAINEITMFVNSVFCLFFPGRSLMMVTSLFSFLLKRYKTSPELAIWINELFKLVRVIINSDRCPSFIKVGYKKIESFINNIRNQMAAMQQQQQQQQQNQQHQD